MPSTATSGPTSAGANTYNFVIFNDDISGNVATTALFEDGTTGEVLSADARASITLPANDFSGVFSFHTDSSELNDLSGTQDIICKTNSGAWTAVLKDQLAHGNLVVDENPVNANYNDDTNFGGRQSIQYDFVRHIAKEVTGGYNNADIFKNEEDLRGDVSGNTNDAIHTDIVRVLDDADGESYALDSSANITGKLLRVLLADNSGVERLLTDMSGTTGSTDASGVTGYEHKFLFDAGDVLFYKVTLKNGGITASGGLSARPVSERSYLIKITMS